MYGFKLPVLCVNEHKNVIHCNDYSRLLSKVEDTKGVIRSRKSNKDRHCNEQEDKQKTNNDVQSTMQKTKGCEQQTNLFLKCTWN